MDDQKLVNLINAYWEIKEHWGFPFEDYPFTSFNINAKEELIDARQNLLDLKAKLDGIEEKC